MSSKLAAVASGMLPLLNAPDVHAGAQPDMLQRAEGLDLALVVNLFRFFGHRNIVVVKMKQSDPIENAKLYFSGGPKCFLTGW